MTLSIRLRQTTFRVIMLAVVALLFALSAFQSEAQTPEFRGYWVDAFHDGFFDSNQVDQLIADARAGNFNALVVEVRKRGDAYYNSNFEPKATNISPDYDPLADLIAKAHDTTDGKQRIEIHAWMVTYHIWNPGEADGIPEQPDHPYNLHPDWLMKDVDGETYIGGQYTFDQGHPEVQRHTYNVAMDIVSNYDVDGINFDYVRYNNINEGYNDVTVARFNQLFGRTGVPSPSDAAWKQFRRDQITALMRKIYVNTMAIKPHVKVSADTITFAPGVTNLVQWYSSSAAWNGVLQDWRGWLEEGIIDLAIPMAYFRQHTHAADWAKWSQFAKDFQYNRQTAIGPGIYLNYTTNVFAQMRSTRELTESGNSAAGVVGYSYAVPNLDGVSREEFHAALTTNGPSIYDPIEPGLFFEKVNPPEMPWKTSPTKGHLKGFVYGGDVSNVLDGAIVRLTGSINKTMTNDATGFYGAVDLEPGNYTVEARFPGFGAASTNVTITAGTVFTADLILSANDDTAPLLFNISVSEITDNSARISWTSDEASASTVEYGTTTNYTATTSDSALVLNHTVVITNLNPLTIYHFRAKSADATNNEVVSEDFVFETNPLGVVGDLIIDNREARVRGTWSTGSFPGFYDFDYRFKGPTTGGNQAYLQFTPNILVAGEYEVYEWHVAADNRPKGAPHVIRFDGGTQTNTVNQQTNGSQWNLVGKFKFAVGTNGYVRITDQFDEDGKFVMADGIKFVYVQPPTQFIIDNPQTSYFGVWTVASAAPDKFANYYQYAPTVVGSSTAQAVYTPTLYKSGKYNVFIWYPQGTNRTVNAQVLIAGNGDISFLTIDQTANGGAWRMIGNEKQFAAGTTGFVRISNDTGENNRIVMADAVRFDYLAPAHLFTQPQSQTAEPGTNVLFSVDARGAEPLKYQWRFNGTNISGAISNTLVLSGVQMTNSGKYSVFVTNMAGSVLSAEATLTVQPFAPAQFNSAALLDNAQIRLSFTGNAGGTYNVDASTNLVDWVTLTNITSPDGNFEFIDSTSATAHRFYRTSSP